MIGLFVLALSVTGIARMARTRGASAWLYGVLAGVGFEVRQLWRGFFDATCGRTHRSLVRFT